MKVPRTGWSWICVTKLTESFHVAERGMRLQWGFCFLRIKDAHLTSFSARMGNNTHGKGQRFVLLWCTLFKIFPTSFCILKNRKELLFLSCLGVDWNLQVTTGHTRSQSRAAGTNATHYFHLTKSFSGRRFTSCLSASCSFYTAGASETQTHLCSAQQAPTQQVSIYTDTWEAQRDFFIGNYSSRSEQSALSFIACFVHS